MQKRIWLITGISSGLGKALARSVMENNDFVIGTFRNQAQVDVFNQRHFGSGFAINLDVTDEGQIERVVKEVISKYGKIDVLVNNAGIGFVGAIEEASIEEVRNVLEVNLMGALKLTQTLLPFMRKEKGGHIIQISSHGGIKAFAGFGIYNASKFALEGFSEALAQEVSPLGIKVSIVEPGPFRTNFAGSSLGKAKAVIDDYAETAGAFRAKLASVDGKQEGDPEKAAIAIIDLVRSEVKSSLRLPLGKTALATINMKIDSLKADLEVTRAIAEQTVFE